MKPRHWFFWALFAVTVARFFCLGRIELTPNEAYHTLWAQHPDWCYFNQGPVLAMIIQAGTGIGGITEFGVRFFSPLLALGTSLLLFILAYKLYGETVAIWSVAVLNALPFFQTGSVLMTSTGPSLFLWAAAMLTFWCALEQSPRFNYFWPVTGLLMGAGFLTEYSHAILLLSIVLILTSTRKYRHELSRPGFWSLFFVFVVLMTPAFYWNAHHEGMSWLSWRGELMEAGINPLRIFRYLGRTALDCSPILLIGILMIVVGRGFNKAQHQFKPRFLLYFSLPLLGLELLLASSKSASMDSMVSSLLGLIILSVGLCSQSTRLKRILIFGYIAVGAGLVQAIFLNFKQPDQTSWKAVAIKVGELRNQLESQTGKPIFLIGNNSRVASILSFYLPQKRIEGPGHPPVYIPESQMIENQFSYWPRYDEFFTPAKDAPPTDPSYQEEQGVNPFIGRTALFISTTEPPTAILNSFEKVESLDSKDAQLKGIHIYRLLNYRSLPL